MSFDAAWLDLREPADRAARDRRLLGAAAAYLADAPAPLAVDLGSGAGALPRAFAALAPDARWRLIDRDAGLLAVATARLPGAEAVAADLADAPGLPLAGARLVTASALLDLASAPWIAALAARLAAEGAAFYASLTYDGRIGWPDAGPLDARVCRAFNRHQRRDKGLGGPALGPAAGAAAASAFRAAGFAVRLAPSPWRLGRREASLQAALVAGVATAAAEEGVTAGRWCQARRAARGCVVGHVDLLALPAATRSNEQSKTTSESSP